MAGVMQPFAGREASDAAVIEESWRQPGRFAEVFDRYYAQIHGYAARRLGVDGSSGKGARARASALLAAGGFFLASEPFPPKVRAVLIRVLVAVPGVSALGQVTDPLGRHGVGLAAPEETITITGQWGTPAAYQGTYRYRTVVILDQANGALLAEEEVLTKPGGMYAHQRPGFVIYYHAARAQGWTNTKPAGPPAALPAG